ncbi:MAG: phage integrase N-terminal SAM-like domain-containing protein, partial [Clostridia bacterium]|nr:phage integrase N-terminal SAM-like domain-containing protein [Clostridia bacterium]
MGKLRDQMVSDLLLRNYSPRTVEAYTWAMFHFVKHFRRSPDLMGEPDIRQFLLHLVEERKAS